MTYQKKLQSHLENYMSKRLGVFENGIYRDKSYPHILPLNLKYLNLLEFVRAELQEHLNQNKKIKFHQYFHHLNSSQAFAFNLFYPYFSKNGQTACALSKALGVEMEGLAWWQFEWIPDVIEGTNIDVAWRTDKDVTVYCEVKLSEVEFGTAENDERHLKKLAEIYRPRLLGLIDESLLEEQTFFKHYQLLRNLSFLSDRKSHLVILLPRENLSLMPQLNRVMNALNPNIANHVHIAYIEDVINRLKTDEIIPTDLGLYANALAEKYIP